MTVLTNHFIFVLMGVSGSGKSVVANSVAHKLSYTAYLDGDFLHPRANIEKMSSGQALDDNDRESWLNAISDAAYAMQRTNPISIVVCSALKKRYRDKLRESNKNISFIYLKGVFNIIEERIKARKGHFFKPQMLKSQFKTLEEPLEDETDIHIINVDQPLEKVIELTLDWIKNKIKNINF